LSIRDFKDGWFNYLIGNLIKSKKPPPQIQKIVDERLEKCLSCEHLRKKKTSSPRIYLQSCSMCGCAFPALAFAYKKSCPDGKWQEIPGSLFD